MYYLLDKKYDETFTINFIGTEQFNVGNKLFLTMPECVKGIVNITSFVDAVNGETSNVYLKKYFRYKNGVSEEWSETQPIEQLTGITICSRKCLQLEIIYFRVDDGNNFPNIVITVSNISIGGTFKFTSSDSQLVLKSGDTTQILEIGDVLKIFKIDAFEVISTAKYNILFINVSP